VKRSHLLLITEAWLLLLVVGSLQPARPGPVHLFHRELHWVAFAGAALLLFVLSRSRRQAIWSTIAVCALGFSLEILQHLIYRNSLEWWDVRDDSLAVLAAFVGYQFILAPKPAPSTSDPPSR
jgi:hypothetical protein